jgi:sugar phosphate permease
MITVVLILSNTATPLYVRWQTEIGFSSTTLVTIFAAYMVGLVLTLLVAGQASDRIGRRPVLLPGLASAILACLTFASAHSVAMLLVARFLSGIAVGTVLTAGIASIVDIGGSKRRRQSSQIASIAMVLGAGLGPLLAGSLAHALSRPIVPTFVTELALLVSATAAALLALPFSDQTDDRKRAWRLRFPSVPRANRSHLAFGIAVFGPGITATSFVLSLGPSLLSKLIGVSSPFVAGSMACAMFLAATSVQLLPGTVSVRSVLMLGTGATAVAMAAIVISIATSSAIALIVAALLAGIGQGLGQLGALTLIGVHVPSERRAEANAVLNIGGYAPAGLLPLGAGYLIDIAGLTVGGTSFAVALATIAIGAGVFVSQLHPKAPSEYHPL